MVKIMKELLKKLWQWVLDQTDIDEQIENEVKKVAKEYKETKSKINEVTGEVIRRYDRIKEEVDDVKKSASEFKKQISHIKEAAAGSNRKGRKAEAKPKITKSSLRALTKVNLIQIAKTEFKVELDSNLTKTNLINKVYELYHK
jgi:hypothetical protein